MFPLKLGPDPSGGSGPVGLIFFLLIIFFIYIYIVKVQRKSNWILNFVPSELLSVKIEEFKFN